ncbi:MAG: cysteine desulfurase [Magnetococcus sp. WYHC-3]
MAIAMIYLDHNASAPLRPEAAQAVMRLLDPALGNPSSVHGPGRAARKVLDEARRDVAAGLGVHPGRVVFTSGGTEANAWALWGVAQVRGFRGRLLISAVEHPSVRAPAQALAGLGMEVVRCPVDGQGLVDPDTLESLLTAETVLVALMHANNETGVIQPVAEVARRCRARGVPLLVDAVQSFGKIPLSPDALGAALVSLSAHKLGGPKGVGALVCDNILDLAPLVSGGGQERGRRSGTENLLGIAGFAAVVAPALAQLDAESARLRELRDALEVRLLEELPALVVLGASAPRLPNTSLLAIPGVEGETLLMALDLAGCAASAGSACSSGRTTPSPVLEAMGVDPVLARGALRVSLGWNTSAADVERFSRVLLETVRRLHSLASPVG